MTKSREMLLDPEEEKLLLPSSSEDEEDSNSDVSDNDEIEVKDPFETVDSDSDAPPEILSKKSANEDDKKFKQHVSRVIKTHIDERKRKRKEIHDQYLKQKDEKRQKIDDKKLPEDILENLKDTTEEENQAFSDNETVSEDKEEKDANSNFEEVVAVHGPTVFKCKILSEESKKVKCIPADIANFKNNLLFGGRIRREKSSRDAMLKQEKQMASHRLKTNP